MTTPYKASQYKAGDSLPPYTLEITAEPMKVVAVVLRDPNPIHLDPAAAAAAGLGDRVINQGPSNVAYVMDMLRRAMPDHRLAAFECKFVSSVRAGDTVVATGTVTEAAGDTVRCEAALTVQDGGVALAATATMIRR